MSVFQETLVREFLPYGVLTPDQLAHVELHFELLSSWNKTLNLTRITTLEDAVRLHYVESLFLASKLPKGPLRIVDIGSGAGFPGIPVAIFRPECSITLVEAHQRKSVVLREAARGLTNVSVESVRAQEITEEFDWIVARAVDPREVAALKQAPNLALLVGEKDGRDLGEGWELQKLPWGEGRVIAFHVEHQQTH
jgi:16S rRNA (guanine527-N7)-methyltransferase